MDRRYRDDADGMVAKANANMEEASMLARIAEATSVGGDGSEAGAGGRDVDARYRAAQQLAESARQLQVGRCARSLSALTLFQLALTSKKSQLDAYDHQLSQMEQSLRERERAILEDKVLSIIFLISLSFT